MCLDAIDEVTKEGNGFGYKTFFQDVKGGLWPLYMIKTRKRPYPVNKWIRTLDRTCNIGYLAGFHIWEEPPIEYINPELVTKKVRYKTVLASGSQYCEKVIVARYIYIED